MSFDADIETYQRPHPSPQTDRCATCKEPIRSRPTAGTSGQVEWAHADPYDRHDATLCVVDYPNNRAQPATERT